MPSVEPASPVTSTRESASSNDQITRKSVSNSSVKNVKQAPILKLSQCLRKGKIQTLPKMPHRKTNSLYPISDYHQVRLKVKLEPDEWIKDNGCSRHMAGNKDLFSSYKAIDRGKKPSLEYFNVFGSKFFILNTKNYLTKFDPKSTEGIFLGYSPNSKAYVILNKETMRVEESLNMRFDESPHPKSSPLVDDDILESEIIEKQEKDLEIKENEPLNKEIVNIKETKDHPIDLVIEPKNVKEAIQYESWTMAMQEELNQFKTNDVWSLVPPPDYQTIIGIYVDETYAPITRLESIRILLAYACAHDFKLFQMDVKSAFLNGFINKEVYVAQPPGYVDFEKPNHVFKLKKALYYLKQAPKAWYDRLKAFLLDHMYTMGLVDNTRFTKKGLTYHDRLNLRGRHHLRINMSRPL
ncbi:retrovirus-related pol polyprotein from transposon TNT 1-94 [Tanacetum coccineum]